MTTVVPGPGTLATDAERLDVYRVAVQANTLGGGLLPAEHRILRDQFERASLSAVLNTAEGAGRRSRKDKRRHYAMARGSAMEACAVVDVVGRRGLASVESCAEVRSLLIRVIQMLSKLDDVLA
jgi:four helix bundle protein